MAEAKKDEKPTQERQEPEGKKPPAPAADEARPAPKKAKPAPAKLSPARQALKDEADRAFHGCDVVVLEDRLVVIRRSPQALFVELMKWRDLTDQRVRDAMIASISRQMG